MKTPCLAWLPILALIALAACGDDDQTVDPGGQQLAASDGGQDATGIVVTVSFDGQSSTVDLGTMATSSYKGVNLVKLSDVWTASGIQADHASLEFEFVASDGFKPSSKGCVDVPGSALEKGYIDPITRNLTWDEALGFKGCYAVDNTTQINAHVPAATSDAGGQ